MWISRHGTARLDFTRSGRAWHLRHDAAGFDAARQGSTRRGSAVCGSARHDTTSQAWRGSGCNGWARRGAIALGPMRLGMTRPAIAGVARSVRVVFDTTRPAAASHRRHGQARRGGQGMAALGWRDTVRLGVTGQAIAGMARWGLTRFVSACLGGARPGGASQAWSGAATRDQARHGSARRSDGMSELRQVRQGFAGTVRLGNAGRGGFRQAIASQAWLDFAWRGIASNGPAGPSLASQARFGEARLCMERRCMARKVTARLGIAGMTGHGNAASGFAWLAPVGRDSASHRRRGGAALGSARQCAAWLGSAVLGMASQAWRGRASYGAARRARRARRGRPSQAQRGMASARRGSARHGTAWHRRQGTVRHASARLGRARQDSARHRRRGAARHGSAGHGLGSARLGEARRGSAMPSRPRSRSRTSVRDRGCRSGE